MTPEERLRDALAIREHARLLCSGEEIQAALARMAAAVSSSMAGCNPIVVAVMQGGIFAAVELCRRLDFPHEFDYLHASRYGASTVGGALSWLVGPKDHWRNRSIVLVDDILDRGHTLLEVQAALTALPAARLHTAVLVAKGTARSGLGPKVDSIGITIDDHYVFGSGLDYRGYWRELHGLYAVTPQASIQAP